MLALVTTTEALKADIAVASKALGMAQFEGRKEDAQALYNLIMSLGGLVKKIEALEA